MGDFNLPYINWTTRLGRAPGPKVIDRIKTSSLQQQVNEPTRQNNILNLVMATPNLRIIGLEFTGCNMFRTCFCSVLAMPYTSFLAASYYSAAFVVRWINFTYGQLSSHLQHYDRKTW
ncbi:hypothetical protein FHG87_000388 [Trinorchestia longiramus]|nr:hypothetical protein FHG87_000388 [Trinorchestia longiramus]